MTSQFHGQMPALQHSRIHRADEPRLRHPIPAMQLPIENANQTLNRVVATLYRGGSNAGNPILSGLATRIQFHLSALDAVVGLYIFQDHALLGPNLSSKVFNIAPGIYGADVVFGSTYTKAGTPATGAVRNFVRIQTKFGTTEREFWVKSKDADIVVLNQLPALDPVTLTAVFISAPIVGAGAWLDVSIDFFASWNDEFQVLHNAKNPFLDTGFLKAYGGAQFVSFFDTTPGTQGVGVAVNPVTDAAIKDKHTIQVQNTLGDKLITVRFRSKAASPYYVDVPIKIRVTGVTCECIEESGAPPVSETHLVLFCPSGSPPPPSHPGQPSTPDVVNPPWVPGTPVAQDLVLVSIQGAVVGSSPRVIVRKWQHSADVSKGSGSLMTVVGSDISLVPQQYPASSPLLGGDYLAPKFYRVAFDFDVDGAAGVAFYEVFLKDGDLTSVPVLIAGPRARDICNFPLGDQGVCNC